MTDNRWTLDPAVDEFLAGMTMSKELIEKLKAEHEPIEAAAPQPGDTAPDFTAERLSGSGQRSGEQLQLSSVRSRPVALQFGSYTCPVWRAQIDRFNEIYEELQDQFQFLTVYTREAHPEDGWKVEINRDQDVVYDQPTTLDERAHIAGTCPNRHGIRMPVLLDDMDDSITRAYSGSPERLYLIDETGIVRHRSVNGPFQMKAIEAWYEALKEYATVRS